MTDSPSSEAAFTRLFVAGVVFRAVLGSLVMLVGAGGVALGHLVGCDWAPFVFGCLGLLVGAVPARSIKLRWDPLNKADTMPATFPIDPGR